MRTFFYSLLAIGCLTFHLNALGLSREDSLSKYEKLDSSEILAASFNYKTGEQELGQGATLQVPAGYRLLDGAQGRILVEHLWGNPENPNIVGVLLPDRMGPMEKNFRGVVISFEPSGYMAESEIQRIDYKKLLVEMKEDLKSDNLLRRRKGAGVITGMDWAFTPYYNAGNHTLHWARILHFGGGIPASLNYEVRVLGRKGALCFTAIGKSTELALIKQQIATVAAGAYFTAGNRYIDFNPRTDQASLWTPVQESVLLRILSFDNILLSIRSILSTMLVALCMVLFVYFMDYYHHHRRRSAFRKMIKIDEHLN
ncbi:DUF2167 domain-containing protein [Chitinophaga arvensicola]|uniref:Uncharacterized membrane-anchored protein n=1 Tax=Chitinophaga arvensicola TaxID=29529 RepID=A0A1I0SCN4_9BACT|nr:DUF2167 domain-containing protein [Chitinophaga arvensicola]SEW53563.1 Uncharacterized membrane-anchored protein [Chitinophaga arvensicola]